MQRESCAFALSILDYLKMKLTDINFGTRLGMGFATILVLMVIMATFGTLRVSHIVDVNHEIAEKNQRYALAAQWKSETRLNLTRAMAIAKSGNNPIVAGYFKPLMTETSATISDRQKKLEALVVNDSDKALMDAIGEKRKAYIAIRESVMAQMQAGDMAGALAKIDAECIPAANNYLDAIDALEQSLQASLDKASPMLDADAQATSLWLPVLATIAVVVGGVLAWVITRSITLPMHRAVMATQRVALGDLSQELDNRPRKDEIGQLQHALSDMQQRLREVVKKIRAATEQVSTASSEIASGGQDLSMRSEQAASNLEETAASMEQLTSSAKQTAVTANGAKELAGTASLVAQRGGEAVAQVVSTMDGITAASKKIVDIISVIDGIAFQTNILALNAAVESARAGEQGRGFAVVAAEVRALAQRSATAAREIKALIADSVTKVESGSHQVQEAGETMSEIVSNVQRVATMIGEISIASNEQQSGIDQINSAVTHLDQMTQQNSALVEQSAAAATCLQEQAAELVDTVRVFRLESTVH
jgi:methyl-accepting chemotaxis protein